MEITQRGNVLSVYHDDVREGWEQWYMLASDIHHDSLYCNRRVEEEHLKLAAERDARILYLGDLFDAMQGKFDPRRSLDLLRPEYRSSKYYDLIVQDTADFLAPYAKHILMFGQGNHETAVRKAINIDLLDRLAYTLNLEHDGNIRIGGYGGWVRFMFRTTLSDGTPNPLSSKKLKYFHGSGGEAPVTRGVIHTNRQAVYLPDADIIVNGHNHHNYIIPITRERISNKGELYFDNAWHIRVPGYMQSYGDGSTGWEVERGGVPKPIGCVFIKLFYKDGRIQMRPETQVEAPDVISIQPDQEDTQLATHFEFPEP